MLRQQSRLDPASGLYTATPPPPPLPYSNEPFFLDTSPSQTYNTPPPSPESAAGVPTDAVKYAAVAVVLGLGMLSLAAILVRRQVQHMRIQVSLATSPICK